MAGSNDRSQNFSSSKSKVKFDFTTVRTRVIPILKRVQVGDYPAKIGRTYGWGKGASPSRRARQKGRMRASA